MQQWRGVEFDSSSGLTPEFEQFAKDYRKSMTEIMRAGYKLVSWSRGHFYCSSFWRHEASGKLVYISCSDVRHFPEGWDRDILIRTAQHDKDYTGGSNNSATLAELKEVADRLIR